METARVKFKALALAVFVCSCSTAPKEAQVEREWIRKAMKFKMRDYFACFSENFAMKPETSGKYVLGFTLDTEGKVVSAEPVRELTTLPKSNLFDDCMIGVLKEIPFPKSIEEITVRYPFHFSFTRHDPQSTPQPE